MRKFSKQRTEKKPFRKKEDHLKIWGLVEKPELGESHMISHGCQGRYDVWGMEATEPIKAHSVQSLSHVRLFGTP